MNRPYRLSSESLDPLREVQMLPSGGMSISRREAMQRTLFGAAGLLLADWPLPQNLNAAEPGPKKAGRPAAPSAKAKAKAVIQIWMWGGPSHLDTFDPKPEAGNDYCGPFNKPIETNVPGIRICELLPLLAKQADKYSIIRSMTHGNNGHETAAYMVQTGWPPGGRVVYPSVGAVVSLFKGRDAGYNGPDPPLYRPDPTARAVLRGGVSWARAISRLLRAATPPRPGSQSKAWSPPASLTSGSKTGASCSTSSTR